MKYQIRRAEENDVAELVAMLRGYLPETYGAEWRGDADRLAHDLAQGIVKIAIAEQDGGIAGFIAYVDTYDLHWCVAGAEVIDFYVRPGHRGLGAAVHLVAWVADEIWQSGARFLKCAPVENPAVRRLYEKTALFQSSGEAYLSGRALRHFPSLSGRPFREMVKDLPKPEWSRET